MTVQLQKAFTKAADLPTAMQDELARLLLEDIKAELQWDRTLASPKSQNLLESLAQKARLAKRRGKVHEKGFDQL
jgi:hypothetical protein